MASNMDKRLAVAERRAGLDDASKPWFLLLLKEANGDGAAVVTLAAARANPQSSYHRFVAGAFGRALRRIVDATETDEVVGTA